MMYIQILPVELLGWGSLQKCNLQFTQLLLLPPLLARIKNQCLNFWDLWRSLHSPGQLLAWKRQTWQKRVGGKRKPQQLRVNSNGRDVFELQLVSSPESLVLITNNYPGDKCCSYSAVNRLQFTAGSDSVVTGM